MMEMEMIEDTCSKQKLGLEKVGGHLLVKRRPIFTTDSKYLLVASGNSVRQYVVESGALLKSLALGHQSEIVSLQINPNSLEQLISTSSDGHVVFTEIEEENVVDELRLPIDCHIEKVNLCHLVSDCFYYLTSADSEKCLLFSTFIHRIDERNNRINDFINGEMAPNSIAFGPTTKPHFIASIYGNNLYVLGIPFSKSSKSIRHLLKEGLVFVCVACHPTEDIIATGDCMGRITLWMNDFLDTNFPTKSILHWHRSISDMSFSTEGSFLYSVGREMTIVRWNLSNTNWGEKDFLPRIGMEMIYLTIDRNHEYLATSHVDNSILIIGSQFTGIKTTIDELCFAQGSVSVPTLSYFERLECLVLNGRVGHLQFYSIVSYRQLFQLDVVSQNLSAEDKPKFRTHIRNFALSNNGEWLATVEFRDDHETLPEMRLKFWKFQLDNFILNTKIHLPHKLPINCLKFSPNSESCVSTSDDTHFKIWKHDFDSIEKRSWWFCDKSGSLDALSKAGCASWSSDCSLLSVGFGQHLTLWDVNDLNATFCETLQTENCSNENVITFIQFGCKEKSPYLAEIRTKLLRVWNLFSLSVVWIYNFDQEIDSCSFYEPTNHITIFCSTKLYVFDIQNKDNVSFIDLEHENIPEKIFSSIVVPHKTEVNFCSDLFGKAQLFGMNQKQELFALCNYENKKQFAKQRAKLIENTDNLTPLAMLFLKKHQKNEALTESETENVFGQNIDSKKLVQEMFYNVPSHILPPINVIANSFLSSLLNSCKDQVIEKEPSPPLKFKLGSLDSDSDQAEGQKEDGVAIKIDDNSKKNQLIIEDFSWMKDY